MGAAASMEASSSDACKLKNLILMKAFNLRKGGARTLSDQFTALKHIDREVLEKLLKDDKVIMCISLTRVGIVTWNALS